MTSPFRRIAIAVRSDFPEKEKVRKEIMDIVKQAGAEIILQTEQPSNIPAAADLVIVIGGDGTIIATIRNMENPAANIVGVHGGTLGFLTTLDAHAVQHELPPLLAGEGILDERQLLRISLEEDGRLREVGQVLNDAVVSQGGISRLLHLETAVDGQELATFRADGLIVATPTGSTAYSLAAGGTIIHPTMRETTTILTPINPHNFFQKPLIVPGSTDIAIKVRTTDNAYRTVHPVLTLDGQVTHPLDRHQIVHATASEQRARFLRRRDDSFYRTLREKLRWSA